MSSNTVIPTNQPEFEPHFSRHEPSKDDPFTIANEHYIGDDGFVVPNNFIEFLERFPDYIKIWVNRHAYWCPAADAEDLTQDLILRIQQLHPASKHRLPGANHRLNGCRDVIETFDPYKQHGASERRFRNYVNLCLANKLRSIRSKFSKDALSQQGNLSFREDSGLRRPRLRCLSHWVHVIIRFRHNHLRPLPTEQCAKLRNIRIRTGIFDGAPECWRISIMMIGDHREAREVWS